MGSVSVWEAIFMLVVLKIPMVYLAVVVWWAVRSEPGPDDGHESARAFVPLTPCGWDDWRRRRSTRSRRWRPLSPTGGRARRAYVTALSARARRAASPRPVGAGAGEARA